MFAVAKDDEDDGFVHFLVDTNSDDDASDGGGDASPRHAVVSSRPPMGGIGAGAGQSPSLASATDNPRLRSLEEDLFMCNPAEVLAHPDRDRDLYYRVLAREMSAAAEHLPPPRNPVPPFAHRAMELEPTFRRPHSADIPPRPQPGSRFVCTTFPTPQSTGLIPGADLALPAAVDGSDGPSTNGSTMARRSLVFGGGAHRRSSAGESADSQSPPGGLFTVERQFRDRDHRQLQETVYRPLRGPGGDHLALGEESIRSLANRLVAQRTPQDSAAATTSGTQGAARAGGRGSGAAPAPYVPLVVRPHGHNEIRYSDQDAERLRDKSGRQKQQIVDRLFAITDATIAEKPIFAKPPPHRRDAEDAMLSLVAFDDDHGCTFRARRLRGCETVERLLERAAAAAIREAVAKHSEARERALFRNPSFRAGVPLPLGASIAGTSDLPSIGRYVARSADPPAMVVVGHALFAFAHDFLSAAVFRPTEAATHQDLWQPLPLPADSFVIEADDDGSDGNPLHSANDDDGRSSSESAESTYLSGPTAERRIPRGHVERPAAPGPQSVLLPLAHPTMGDCVIAISPADNTVYGIAPARAGPRLSSPPRWRTMRLYGLQLGGSSIIWGLLLSATELYMRSSSHHCVCSIAPLLGAMLDEFHHADRDDAAPEGSFGGDLIFMSDAVPSVTVEMLRSPPPEEALVGTGAFGVALSTHAGERHNTHSGVVARDTADVERSRAMAVRYRRRIANALEHEGIQLPADLDAAWFGPIEAPDVGDGPADENANGGGDAYVYDAAAGCFVPRPVTVRCEHRKRSERHTWLWLWCPAARNMLPWRRIDGLHEPLPVTLRNHLPPDARAQGPQGDVLTTFFLGECELKVAPTAEASAKQTFLKPLSKLVWTPPPTARRVWLHRRNEGADAGPPPPPAHGDPMPVEADLALTAVIPPREASVHVKAPRHHVIAAVPMPDRCVALVAADLRTYVVVEMDRHLHNQRFL